MAHAPVEYRPGSPNPIPNCPKSKKQKRKRSSETQTQGKEKSKKKYIRNPGVVGQMKAHPTSSFRESETKETKETKEYEQQSHSQENENTQRRKEGLTNYVPKGFVLATVLGPDVFKEKELAKLAVESMSFWTSPMDLDAFLEEHRRMVLSQQQQQQQQQQQNRQDEQNHTRGREEGEGVVTRKRKPTSMEFSNDDESFQYKKQMVLRKNPGLSYEEEKYLNAQETCAKRSIYDPYYHVLIPLTREQRWALTRERYMKVQFF